MKLMVNDGKDNFLSTLGALCVYQNSSGLPHRGSLSESGCSNPYYFSALANMVDSECIALSVVCAILGTR